MAKAMEALGMLEAKGFIALVEATDAMMKWRTFSIRALHQPLPDEAAETP